MTWTCPHQIRSACKLLKRKCKPGIKGCVLSNKVKFIDIDEKDGKRKKDR